MKYKDIKIGGWYYVRRWPWTLPRDVCTMKVIQKCKHKSLIAVLGDGYSPLLCKAKNVLAEVINV